MLLEWSKMPLDTVWKEQIFAKWVKLMQRKRTRTSWNHPWKYLHCVMQSRRPNRAKSTLPNTGNISQSLYAYVCVFSGKCREIILFIYLSRMSKRKLFPHGNFPVQAIVSKRLVWFGRKLWNLFPLSLSLSLSLNNYTIFFSVRFILSHSWSLRFKNGRINNESWLSQKLGLLLVTQRTFIIGSTYPQLFPEFQ